MTTTTETKTFTQTSTIVVAISCADCDNRVVPARVWAKYNTRTRNDLAEHGLLRASDQGLCASCQAGVDIKIWEADLSAQQARIDEAIAQGRGLCSTEDSSILFSTVDSKVAAAKRMCGQCPQQQACLDMALENDEQWGIWGGLTAEERLELNTGPINLTQRAIRMGLVVDEPDMVELVKARQAEQAALDAQYEFEFEDAA